MAPLGLTAFERVAVSVTAVPIGPPTLGIVANAGEAFALAPARVRLAVPVLPVAVSVALSVWPGVAGAYCTVTLHDFFEPRLIPVQVSAVLVNADDPAKVTPSIPLTLPEFVRVNTWDTFWPAFTVPKLYVLGEVVGDQLSTAVPLAVAHPVVGNSNTTEALAATAARRIKPRIAFPRFPTPRAPNHLYRLWPTGAWRNSPVSLPIAAISLQKSTATVSTHREFP